MDVEPILLRARRVDIGWFISAAHHDAGVVSTGRLFQAPDVIAPLLRNVCGDGLDGLDIQYEVVLSPTTVNEVRHAVSALSGQPDGQGADAGEAEQRAVRALVDGEDIAFRDAAAILGLSYSRVKSVYRSDHLIVSMCSPTAPIPVTSNEEIAGHSTQPASRPSIAPVRLC